jgi:hypothetical protein
MKHLCSLLIDKRISIRLPHIGSGAHAAIGISVHDIAVCLQGDLAGRHIYSSSNGATKPPIGQSKAKDPEQSLAEYEHDHAELKPNEAATCCKYKVMDFIGLQE